MLWRQDSNDVPKCSKTAHIHWTIEAKFVNQIESSQTWHSIPCTLGRQSARKETGR
jgi:hypothetical protein